MSSQIDFLLAQKNQLAAQQQALYGPSYGSLLGQAVNISTFPLFGIHANGRDIFLSSLKGDFEGYMRECRREIHLT